MFPPAFWFASVHSFFYVSSYNSFFLLYQDVKHMNVDVEGNEDPRGLKFSRGVCSPLYSEQFQVVKKLWAGLGYQIFNGQKPL